MSSEHGGLVGNGSGAEVRGAAADPWDVWHRHVESLLARAKLGPREFATEYGFNVDLVARWASQRRMPPPRFLECLLTAVEKAVGAPLTGEVRQETVRLYRSLRDLSQHPGLRELIELESEIQHLTAQVSQGYHKIRALQAHLTQLRTAGQDQAAATGELQTELRLLQLEVARLRAEWEWLRAQREEREKSLPTTDRALYDAEPQLPAQQPIPPWWTPPAHAAFIPPPPPYPALPPRNRGAGLWRLTAIVAMTLLAVLALAVGGWALLGFPVPRTAASGTAASGTPATTPATTPEAAGATPRSPQSPQSPAASSDGSGGQSAHQTGQWKVIYRDQRITLPEPSQRECGLASVDFDIPRGYEGSSLDGTDDLMLQTACSVAAGADSTSAYDNITFQDQLRGTSSPNEPSADQCVNDANQQGLSENMSLNDFAVGTAYCLVTPKQGIVWFKVVATTGDNNKGRILQATLWSQTGGH